MTDVATRHPSYTLNRIREWRLMRDATSGESAIKEGDTAYLPRPSGFDNDSTGDRMWDAYKSRAQFPEIVAPSLSALLGVAHGREVTIEMPDALAYLFEDADGEGTPLEEFHRQLTRELLGPGRVGVLVDVPEGSPDPVLLRYNAETIINWDRDFYVLDESGTERAGFGWEAVTRYRVLSMLDGQYVQTPYDGTTEGITIAPSAQGGRPLAIVPFAVANALQVSPAIVTPPLIGVARAAVASYQLSADYRWQLYMSGVETLVAINGEKPSKVGPGVVHEMMGAEGVTPDLKYVSPSCSGIAAHKEAINDNRIAAIMAGARLLEQSEQVQESGAARKLRFQSEMATLKTVVLSSCGLLERSLRNAALFKGLNPDAVVVTPPDELMTQQWTPQEALAFWELVERNALSYETFYAKAQAAGVASMERTAEQEFQHISREAVGADDGPLGP
tara:strand:- start:466 stop:1806 length:1341 start_codon:yes stop_codon:yes gene_type:complete